MHDACGCGHAHEAQLAPQTINETPESVGQLEVEQGCGDNCGCGPGMEPMTPEIAAMRGFLSGVYSTTLGRTELQSYLESMGTQEGSEFAAAAQFLAERLKALPTNEADDATPAAWDLLEAVSGDAEADEQE